MALKFTESSCLIVGTFNIYIINPDWLNEIGVLKDQTKLMVETQLNQPGFRFSSPSLPSKWAVWPNKLVIETSDPHEDCGATADSVLENLPWTPLMGIGCNFVFEGTPDDVPDWETKTAFPPAGDAVTRRTWHSAFKREEQTFNLTMSEGSEVTVGVNIHTDVQHEKDVAFARTAAQQFMKFKTEAEELIAQVLGSEVTYDTIN